MTITAKVRKRMIENGRLVHAIVQGESNATTILFRIEGETDLVAEETLFLYLLYKRPNDQTVQLPILLDYTIEDGVILATFTPGAYFTADAGPVEISVIATSSAAELGGSGEVTNTLLWSSFPAWLLVAPSQLADSSTIIEENVFTQYLAELEALDADAKDYASDAEEYAKGTRSDGGTVTHATDNAKYYKNLAKDWAMKTGGPVEGVEMSAKVYAASSQNYATESQQWANKMDGKVLGTDYSAKYYAGEASDSAYAAGQSAESAAASAQIVEDHAEAIEAIADDLTNIDSVAGKLTEIGTVAGDLANIDAVAGNKTNIDAVNANKTNIDTVAGKTTEITTVAGKANDVTTVAGIASDVTKVAAVDDDVSAVAAIDSDVSAVAAAASDVTAVSGALSDISDVATDLNDDDSAIRAVAADMTGVSAVAADLANIDAVAADLANIDNAEANALKAEGWANGTQNGTPVSSDSPYYENNAKYWADAVPDLKSAIDKNTAEIENLKQTSAQTEITVDYPKDAIHTELFPNLVPAKSAKYAEVKSIVGKSRAWNQQLNKANFPATTTINNVTFTNNGDGSITVSTNGSASDSAYIILANNLPTLGHKWLLAGCPNGGNGLSGFTLCDIVNDEYDNGSGVVFSPSSAMRIIIRVASGTTIATPITFWPIIRDLTLIFPEGVPATVAECVQKCPDILKYDAYGTSIVDTTVEGVRSISKNLFDNSWLLLISGWANDGTYYYGANNANRTAILAKIAEEVIPKIGNQQIAISCKGKAESARQAFIIRIFYTDNTNDSLSIKTTSESSFSLVSASGKVVREIDFTYASSGTDYIRDFQIELGSTVTSYSPYMTDTLSLPTSVTLRSAGDGTEEAHDTLDLESGVITRNVIRETISVDFIYTRPGNTSVKFAVFTTSKAFLGGSILHKLTWKNGGTSSYDFDSCTITNEMLVYSSGSHQLAVSVPYSYSKSDAETLLNGTPFNYAPSEVATESVTPVINNTIRVEGNGTIETIQGNTYPDDSPAPTIDNSMTVNFDLVA